MSLFLHINFEFVAGRLLKVMAVQKEKNDHVIKKFTGMMEVNLNRQYVTTVMLGEFSLNYLKKIYNTCTATNCS